MPSLLAKRLDALEAAMGGADSLAIGRQCRTCGAAVELTDVGPCQAHRPLREAEKVLLVTFHTPHAEP
jgi:hypothetical protein